MTQMLTRCKRTSSLALILQKKHATSEACIHWEAFLKQFYIDLDGVMFP